MQAALPSDTTVFMIAPNVGEQMGGEAVKALQIYNELKKLHENTILITHERNRAEVIDRLKLKDVLLVNDTVVATTLWRSVVLRAFLNVWFSKKAIELAETYVTERGLDPKKVILHQTEPNSPVSPRATSRTMINVFGPINGNIYYPKAFRKHETPWASLRRIFHFPLQYLNRGLLGSLKRADMIMVAGGDRSLRSVIAGGARQSQIVECIDCGIPDPLLERPRITQEGENHRYVQYGRLVFHKGTHLIIKSLVKEKGPVQLDIVGRGPELENLQALTRELGLEDRVRFLGWYPSREDLLSSLGSYRGVILPSIEDANGIVVQEAMALGLPAICLDWGGPQLLVKHNETGYLVDADSEEQIVADIAQYMDILARDGALAERMSVAGREIAQTWRWSATMKDWSRHYVRLIEARVS